MYIMKSHVILGVHNEDWRTRADLWKARTLRRHV